MSLAGRLDDSLLEVARLSALPDGALVPVRLLGRRLLLLRRGPTVVAADELCTHEAASLAGGTVAGTEVTCPMHLWRFDLATGRCLAGTTDLTIHETRLDGDRVLVRLATELASPGTP